MLWLFSSKVTLKMTTMMLPILHMCTVLIAMLQSKVLRLDTHYAAASLSRFCGTDVHTQLGVFGVNVCESFLDIQWFAHFYLSLCILFSIDVILFSAGRMWMPVNEKWLG